MRATRSGHAKLSRLANLAKQMTWATISQLGLHGLCSWDLRGQWLRLERREMHLPRLSPCFEGARLVHLSDLHCDPLITWRHLEVVIDAVNQLEPDFVVLSGDFITYPVRHYVRKVARLLREMEARYGAVACLGNHDLGLWHPSLRAVGGLGSYVADQLASADVFCLHNEAHTFLQDGKALQFVGTAELWGGEYNPERAFADISDRYPTIALCHNPDAGPELQQLGADYVLAGHTHGIPVGPNRLSEWLFPTQRPEFVSGEYPLNGHTRMYVNRGIGSSRRHNSRYRPEITLFTLRSLGEADRPTAV